MTYNMTAIDNGTNIIDWFIAINGWFDGTFTPLLLLEFFLITLISSSRIDFKISMVASSFVTMFTSIIFAYLEWCAWEVIATPIVLFIASLIVMFWGDGN